MSPGIAILVGVVGTFAVLGLIQAVASRRAKALEGEPVPDLPGPIGDAVRGTTLVWFHSPTCGPCRAMHPTIAAMEREGRAVAVDVSTDLDVAKAFNVFATPTTVKIVDGRILAVRMGALSPAQLAAL